MRLSQRNSDHDFFQFSRNDQAVNEPWERRSQRSTRLGGERNVLVQSHNHRIQNSRSPALETSPGPATSTFQRPTELNRKDRCFGSAIQNSELIWNGNSREILNYGTQEPAQPVAPRIVNGTPTSGYSSVGLIGDSREFFCSGTLIASRYVLTAAHCAIGVAATNGRFLVNGITYSTSRVFVHPQYNDNTLANDIAIYELNRDVTGVAATQIFRGTPQIGQLLTLVGFGAGGTGNTGHDGSFGTKRFGTTPIDGVEPTLITWRFDNESESNTAPGDSGGAAFLTVNGIQYLAGITSGGSNADAGIGDDSFDTRVDAFKTWIDSIVGGGTVGGGSDDHVNSPGTNATKLTFNSAGIAVGTGILETGSDRDVFRFDVSSAGNATIALTGANGLDTYLRVYNAAGQLVGENDDSGNTLNSRLTLNLSVGTYYASASSYSDSGTGNYSLNVQHAVGSGDDHGNSFATASQITLNSLNKVAVNAVAESGADVDVFRFRAPASGSFVVRATGLSGGIDPILEIYNDQGQRIAYNDDWDNTLNSRTLFQVDANKNYFARLSTYGDTQGDYRLNLVQRDVRSQRSAHRSDDLISLDMDKVISRSPETSLSLTMESSPSVSSSSRMAFRLRETQLNSKALAGVVPINQIQFDRHHQREQNFLGLSGADC